MKCYFAGKQLAKLTSEQVQPARIGEKFAIIVDGLSGPARSGAVDPANPHHPDQSSDAAVVSIGVGTRRSQVKRERRLSRKVGEALYKAKHTAAAAWIRRHLPVRQVGSLLRATAVSPIYSDGERSV